MALVNQGAGVLHMSSSVPCENSTRFCIVSFYLNGSVRAVLYDSSITSPTSMASSVDGHILYVCNSDTQGLTITDTRTDRIVDYWHRGWKRLDAVALCGDGQVVVAADDALYFFSPYRATAESSVEIVHIQQVINLE